MRSVSSGITEYYDIALLKKIEKYFIPTLSLVVSAEAAVLVYRHATTTSSVKFFN